ncbi:MAG: hypothetical protein AAGC47_13235, partial [Bacteroidota bacterium]
MIAINDFKEPLSGSMASKLLNLSLLLAAFLLPITPKGVSYPVGFMVIFWLFAPKSFSKEKVMVVFLFSAIYLFHLIAMLYTEDVARGTRDLGQ